MNRKERRKADKNSPIPTRFDTPIQTVPVSPSGPKYRCPGDQGQGCDTDAAFLVLAQRDGQRWGFPACHEHIMGVAQLIDSRSPKHAPRPDIADCAKDMEAGLDSLGWDPEMPMGEEVLNRGGVHIMPCPVCSEAGITDHLLKVRKTGEKFSVEAVAA